MKRILLTGGAGYIGSHIAVALAERGYQPVIIDNLSNSDPSVLVNLEKLLNQPIEFYPVNCFDFELLRSTLAGIDRIDGVIHLAAFKAVGESVEDPLKYYHNNISAMVSLLAAMNAERIPHLVFSSSCTVYGMPDQVPVTEETPIGAAYSPYGYSKQVCERIMEDAQRAQPSLKCISLRYFNPIGAHPSGLIGELPIGKPNNLVPYLAEVAMGWRDELTVFGNDYPTADGTCIRDYIHVCDVAEAHVAALDFLEKSNAANPVYFNIGTGQGTSVKEIIDSFEDANNLKVPYRVGPRRAGDVPSIFADASKAEKELNWHCKYSIYDAMKHVWKWQNTLKKPV